VQAVAWSDENAAMATGSACRITQTQEKNGVEGIVGAGTHQGRVYHPRYRVEDSRTKCLPGRRKARLSLGLYLRASTTLA